MEDVNKRRRISFSLSKLECGPQEINSREIRLHLFQQIGINATKIEKTEILLKLTFLKLLTGYVTTGLFSTQPDKSKFFNSEI